MKGRRQDVSRRRIPFAAPLALALLASLGGCTRNESPPTEGAAQASLESVPSFRRWSERLAQGGQPQGEEGYAALVAEGVSLVLSVDGQPPDGALAKRHGLRVAHVPIGYDGIQSAEALSILRACQDAPEGTVYVHCHHGKHRGPAAAALVRIGLEGVSPRVAEEGLRESGCSPRYLGLYAAVRSFKVPDPATLAACDPPPEAVRPKGTRAAMLELNLLWEGLEAARKAGWRQPPSHPDVDPAHQATLVWESLRELHRAAVGVSPQAFEAEALEAELSAKGLREALEAGERVLASERAKVLAARCDSCHAEFRNN